MKFSIVDVFSQGKYTGNQLAVFKEAGHLSTEEMQKIAKEINFSETTFILSNEPTEKGYPVRIFTPGFTEKDVNVDAPPLFTDVFWLGYMHEMTMHGLAGYSISFSVSTRKDIRDHYFQCNIDAMGIYNKSIEILLSKGIYQQSPYFSTSQRSQSVTEIGYVMDLFGDKRPLNSMEAGNIFLI